MRASFLFAILLLVGFQSRAAEVPATAGEEAEQREKLFRRFLGQMRGEGFPVAATNLAGARMVFDTAVVHPSFGIRCDSVPAPTVHGTNAMASTEAFVRTNGWNMHPGALIFGFGMEKPKRIRGLPWMAIQDREFPALTHEGILYVILHGWHHTVDGVAYNPQTNRFPSTISAKHVGEHWYSWTQPEDQPEAGGLPQIYEGQKAGEPGGAASRSQPIRSEINRTSSAAGAGR